MTTLKALLEYTNELLSVERFRDYAPNGLQVEGRAEVGAIVSGVTASLPLPRRRMPSLCTTAISGRARTPASPA
jgi:hypothetical protein